MCRNHRYFVETTVAASKLGMTCLYMNTAFAGPQLTEVAQREKPNAIVFDEEFSELLEDAGKRRKRYIAWHDSDPSDLNDETLEQVIERGDPEDPVPPAESGKAIILTSGTTGTPKGASRKQPETIGPAVALLSRIPLKAREKTFIVAPLFHSWGFAHFTLGLMLGSTYVLTRKYDPEGTLSLIAQHQATAAPMVPVMVQRIMELPEEKRTKYDLSSLNVDPAVGLGAARRAGRQVHGRVRGHPLQPLRLDRGGVGDDRHPRRPARRARHRGRPAARHRREDLRREGQRGADRRDGPHLRRQRDAVRGLHGRRLEGRHRRPDGDRRRRLRWTRRTACSSPAATTR